MRLVLLFEGLGTIPALTPRGCSPRILFFGDTVEIVSWNAGSLAHQVS